MQSVTAIPVHVRRDHTLRAKIIDACGMTCTFCHNEGTPVAAAQRGAGALGRRVRPGRVSLYAATNGVGFVPSTMNPDADFTSALASIRSALHLNELHLTGGEPTLHPRLPDLVRAARALGFKVAITSNGENGPRMLPECAGAGLNRVNFSVFGTTAADLAQVQHPRFRNAALASQKLAALRESIRICTERGIQASANVVVPSYAHRERVLRLLETHGGLTVRLLNSLAAGEASIQAILRILDELHARPVARYLTAGVSGARTEYRLPNGQAILFKEIRSVRLPKTCRSCRFNNDRACHEGYYGIRLYRDQLGRYLIGACIQRMDLCQTVTSFLTSELCNEIVQLREDEYTALQTATTLPHSRQEQRP